MKMNPDGSLTLYIQKDSPGKEKEGQLAASCQWARKADKLALLISQLSATSVGDLSSRTE